MLSAFLAGISHGLPFLLVRIGRLEASWLLSWVSSIVASTGTSWVVWLVGLSEISTKSFRSTFSSSELAVEVYKVSRGQWGSSSIVGGCPLKNDDHG